MICVIYVIYEHYVPGARSAAEKKFDSVYRIGNCTISPYFAILGSALKTIIYPSFGVALKKNSGQDGSSIS